MDLYARHILDHYQHPRHTGRLEHPTCSHSQDNPSCGDDIAVDLLLTDDRIQSIAWQGQGCAISQAAMSIASEQLIGRPVADVLLLTLEQIQPWLGVEVTARRLKCALLGLLTVQNAILVQSGQAPRQWADLIPGENTYAKGGE